jgi:hypothetical protein
LQKQCGRGGKVKKKKKEKRSNRVENLRGV